MPRYEQSITTGNMDSGTLLAIVYSAMKKSNFDVLFASSDSLIGNVPKTWKNNGQKIICKVAGNELIASSEMVHGEITDIFGINKKNTEKLIDAVETLKISMDDYTIENNKIAIDQLRQKTIETHERLDAEAAELSYAMNLAGSNLYLTYSIVAINTLVFILMIADGAGIFGTNPFVHIKWGSNYSTLTLGGDWWRLLSSTFIHFGIIHLAMNMYCLYVIGIYLEPLLGKLKFIAAYLCTGVLAGIVSIWWHKDAVNSAGASGAIFGMYGLFLALLTSTLIPKTARQQLLQSIGIFIVYNLLYGAKSGVDNAAHAGGLVSGFLIGLIYIPVLKKERQPQQKLNWVIPVIVMITAASTYSYLQQNKVSDSEKAKVLDEVRESSYTGNEKFNEQLGRFDVIHKVVNEIVTDTLLTNEELVKKIADTGLPKLNQAMQLINATAAYDVSPASHEKANKLVNYIGLRKTELEILQKMGVEKNNEHLMNELREVREKYEILFENIVER